LAQSQNKQNATTLSNAADAINGIIAFVLVIKMKFPSVGSAINVKVRYNPSPKF
jgi:hypothetical protein